VYVGHPNGPAAWTRNLEAAGTATIIRVDGSREVVEAVRLPAGPEREAVIRATWSQQPFPANLLYSAARDHVRQRGLYYRLDPRPAMEIQQGMAPSERWSDGANRW